MIFVWIEERRGEYPIAVLCRVLGVSRSGYYARANRPRSETAVRREELVAHIRAVHAEVRERYGSPRLAREMKVRGVTCCVNTVAKAMRAHGLRAKAVKRFVRTTHGTAQELEARRRLAVARVEDGWTQREVAAFLGVHPVTVAKWVARFRDQGADAVIAATPALAADAGLLASIPGVGPQTASTVLAELPPVSRVPSAQAAAAYCGLSPREFKSGSSVRGRTRLSKSGNARLRKALYLPTLTAVRFNPILRRFFESLIDPARLGGPKAKMQAIGACMRKLVMICYGVLKSRTPFDPNRGSKIAT